MTAIVGTFDGFEPPRRAFGWVLNTTEGASAKLSISVFLDGTLVGCGNADQHRWDLGHLGDGHIAYDFDCNCDLSLLMFAEGRVRVDASLEGIVVGPIDFGQVFRRTVATHLIETTVRISRSALGFAGAEHIVEAISCASVDWSEANKQQFTKFLTTLALPEKPRQEPELAAQVVDPAVSATLRRFESLGSNCEFGLVQRHFGVEQNGLLRWGSCQRGLPGLLEAFRARFHAAGESVSLSISGPEYISRDDTYALVFHTDRLTGSVRPEVLIRNEQARISYLARNIIEDIQQAEKIFVYKDKAGPTLDELVSLYDELSAIGPVTLLWVTVASDPSKIGTVERLQDGIIRGYIDRFSPEENIHEYCSFDLWLQLCQGALALLVSELTVQMSESVI